jgi:hypothetical protein
LLDELLKSTETSINLVPGAPDPTAGASRNDPSVWCLDEQILTENVHKTLVKFIMPNAPHVVSDIECLELHSSSSATAAEYTSLLRPLRGREPEGMWNLMSIVREMFKRRDKNSIPLLRILTYECVGIEQILQLWFLVKSSQFYYDKALFNSISTSHHHHHHHHSHRHVNSNGGGGNGSSNLTPPVHQACANLMDEIVSLWKLACLNPLVHDFDERQLYCEQLYQWQQAVYEKVRKFYSAVLQMSSNNMAQNNNNVNSNNNWGGSSSPANGGSSANGGDTSFEKMLKRLDMDLFAGFMPAIHASRMAWSEFDLDRTDTFKRHSQTVLTAIEVSSSLNEVKFQNNCDLSVCSNNLGFCYILDSNFAIELSISANNN